MGLKLSGEFGGFYMNLTRKKPAKRRFQNCFPVADKKTGIQRKTLKVKKHTVLS